MAGRPDFRDVLVDVTGMRTAPSFASMLYSPGGGSLCKAFRAARLEMPPHERMSLVQQLLRAHR
jgi:uncharacterized protein (DUF2126 family)